MLRIIYYLFLLCSLASEKNLIAEDMATSQNAPLLDARNDYQNIWSKATNGLQPEIVLGCSASGWDVDISLLAQTNFPPLTWLAISNRVGSELELWQTNGVQIISTNPNVLAAFQLPKQTTVSEARRGIYHERRGGQWLGAGKPVYEGTLLSYTGSWDLRSAFDIPLTNDYVLKITPLIYKVETNEVTAHLVEFPPIKIKLMSNGNIQKLEN